MEIVEAIEEAVIVRALHDLDLLDLSCDGCKVQDEYNCFARHGSEVDEKDLIYRDIPDRNYDQCPLSIVPNCVNVALSNRAFRKEFGGSSDRSQVAWLEWFILSRYDYYISKYREKVRNAVS